MIVTITLANGIADLWKDDSKDDENPIVKEIATQQEVCFTEGDSTSPVPKTSSALPAHLLGIQVLHA